MNTVVKISVINLVTKAIAVILPFLLKHQFPKLSFNDPILISSSSQFISGLLFFGLNDYFLMRSEETDKSSEFFSSIIRGIVLILFTTIAFSLKFTGILIWVLIEVVYQMLWHYVRKESTYSKFLLRHWIVFPLFLIVLSSIYYLGPVEYLFVSAPIVFRLSQAICMIDVVYINWSKNWIDLSTLLRFKWHIFDGILSNFNKNIVEFALAGVSSVYTSDYYLIKRIIKTAQEFTYGILSQLKIKELTKKYNVFRSNQIIGVIFVSFVVFSIVVLNHYNQMIFSTLSGNSIRWLILLLMFIPISFAYQNQLIFSSSMEYYKVVRLDAIHVLINIMLFLMMSYSVWILLIGFSVRAVFSSLYTSEYVVNHFNIARFSYYFPLLISVSLTLVLCLCILQ